MPRNSKINFRGHRSQPSESSKIHLPTELWLLICEFLGDIERRSLSTTCRSLYSLVQTRAPFREFYLHGRHMWNYVSIRRHSEALSSGRAIHWGDQQKWVWGGYPLQSTNSLSVSAASFRYILSILSRPSSLHTLSLTWLRVEPVHQKLILSIKTLRSLRLVNSSFIFTSMVMPRSSITDLWLKGPSTGPTKHLFTLLGSSIETLRFWGVRAETYEVPTSTPLPRLTYLTEQYIINPPKCDHFAAFLNIRVLIISSLGPYPVPCTALPHLNHLAAPYTIAKALLPGRPVHTYRLSFDPFYYGWSYTRSYLTAVAPYAQHVEELQLTTVMAPETLVEILAVHLPNVMRVRLMVDKFQPTSGPLMPQSGENSVHHSLKEFDIGFAVMKDRPFPREDCWVILRRLTGVCPALEVVRFGALFPVEGGGIDERNVPLDWLMDLRRTTEGEWEERRWEYRNTN